MKIATILTSPNYLTIRITSQFIIDDKNNAKTP